MCTRHDVQHCGSKPPALSFSLFVSLSFSLFLSLSLSLVVLPGVSLGSKPLDGRLPFPQCCATRCFAWFQAIGGRRSMCGACTTHSPQSTVQSNILTVLVQDNMYSISLGSKPLCTVRTRESGTILHVVDMLPVLSVHTLSTLQYSTVCVHIQYMQYNTQFDNNAHRHCIAHKTSVQYNCKKCIDYTIPPQVYLQ